MRSELSCPPLQRPSGMKDFFSVPLSLSVCRSARQRSATSFSSLRPRQSQFHFISGMNATFFSVFPETANQHYLGSESPGCQHREIRQNVKARLCIYTDFQPRWQLKTMDQAWPVTYIFMLFGDTSPEAQGSLTSDEML